jgi:hypothetical protein
MNTLLNALKNEENKTYTENGAAALKSTGNAVYDLFATGAAYRTRSDSDILNLFITAWHENPELALKCLFYLRDIRGGQGERRFFRVCMRWLATNEPKIYLKNLGNISEYGRWDDMIYTMDASPDTWTAAAALIKHQLALDCQSKTPSLLAKWMPSENASSQSTKEMAHRLAYELGLTSRQYRKMLSGLRAKINVLERLMSANRWNEIDFSKIPSKAGLVYKNAFARRDIIAKKYEHFAKDKNTKVNAEALYPYEIVAKVSSRRYSWYSKYQEISETNRAIINKYWENLPDYLNGADNNILCVVDTSGSMTKTYGGSVKPIDVAISLGLYCAERNRGAFANHYISFASKPHLIATNGYDFVDKVQSIYKTNLVDNTNLEAVFDLLLNMITSGRAKVEDLPSTIVVISDMQIDSATCNNWHEDNAATEMEKIKAKWTYMGFRCPKIVYWNVSARGDANIIDKGPDVSFVSGFSPVIFKSVLTGKTGRDLMLEVICGKRYEAVTL